MGCDLHILVVNIDNLKLTRDCIDDLMRQMDTDFELTVVDNGSKEMGTADYMNMLKKNGVSVIQKQSQEPLNRIWNDFYRANTGNKYLCYLNNDTRLSVNYTKSIRDVFELEPGVGLVGHVTNNPKYSTAKELEYVVLFNKMRQGWDFCIRREAYRLIPKALKTYCGDDYLYNMLYKNGWKAAMILSSPIIHYLGMSGKSTTREIYDTDVAEFKKHGLNLDIPWSGYSIVKPPEPGQYRMTTKLQPLLTVCMVTYQRYEEIREAIEMWLCQTDPRFILAIYQDGPDAKKRKIVDSYHDSRIQYYETQSRANQYGHNMRHQSLMNCKTKYWCTTNDDNWPSPNYVEIMLREIEHNDICRCAVAMRNLPKTPGNEPDLRGLITSGIFNAEQYGTGYKVLLAADDSIGEIDACQFIVNAAKAQKIGWTHMEFHGDYLFYNDLMNNKLSIRRINKTLQVHR